MAESSLHSNPARSDVTADGEIIELAPKSDSEKGAALDDHLRDIPDGGLRAWLSVLGG